LILYIIFIYKCGRRKPYPRSRQKPKLMRRFIGLSVSFLLTICVLSCKKNAQEAENAQNELVNNRSSRTYVARDLSKRVEFFVSVSHTLSTEQRAKFGNCLWTQAND
jgi:hypothetical protein